MKIIEPVGTSYLCSEFVNHDGTLCSDHPIYSFKTDIDGLYACVMITTSANPYTVKSNKGTPISFKACSTHKSEKESERILQAEVYLFKESDVKLSEYTFKDDKHSRRFFSCIVESISSYLKNSSYGIKSVHYFNNKEDIKETKEVLLSLFNLSKKICFEKPVLPRTGIINSEFIRDTKYINKSLTYENNKKIFDQRKKMALNA